MTRSRENPIANIVRELLSKALRERDDSRAISYFLAARAFLSLSKYAAYREYCLSARRSKSK